MSAESQVDIYEPVIAALRAEVEQNLRIIETLEAKRSGGVSTSPSAVATPIAPQNGTPVFSNDSFFGLTIGEAAKKYLGATKKTAPVKIISDALLAGGLKSAARNPVENVRSTLTRLPAFVLINGEFGLTEWYPGRKAATKQRAGSQQVSSAGEQVESAEDSFSDTKEPL